MRVSSQRSRSSRRCSSRLPPRTRTSTRPAARRTCSTTRPSRTTATCSAAALGAGTRRPTADLQAYQHAVAAATQNNPRVRVIEKKMSDTALGREVSTRSSRHAGQHRQPRRRRNDAGVLARRARGHDLDRGRPRRRRHPAGVRVGHGHPARRRAGRGRGVTRMLYELAGADRLRQRRAGCRT